MIYLLDTNICIYLLKQKSLILVEKFKTIKPGQAFMSVISFGELAYGVAKSEHKHKNTVALNQLIEIIPPLALDNDTAKFYGNITAELSRKGIPIGTNDAWIAAHALANNAVLVTNNEKAFARIPKLKYENWC